MLPTIMAAEDEMRGAMLAGALALMLTGSPAIAAEPGKLIAAPTATDIATLIRDKGYRSQLAKNAAGKPLIHSAIGGYKTVILFYNCPEGSEVCRSMQFLSSFRFPTEKRRPSLQLINDYNAKWRYTDAFMAGNGLVILTMDVELSGGITPKTVSQYLTIWDRDIARFANHINLAAERGAERKTTK